MQNDITKRYYSFFVSINSFLEERPWKDVSNGAQSYYVDFLNGHEYGDKLLSTTFNFYVEQNVDYNKQDDNISTSTYLGIPKSARLTLHFEYNYFHNCDDKEKFLLTINGILYLLNYWDENLKIPEGNPLKEIIKDFEEKLKQDNFLLSEDKKLDVFIKAINPFRFYFMRHHFDGIWEKDILFSTNEIERFLNNNLIDANFGKSLKKIFFSYDIFDFIGVRAKNFIDSEKKYQYGKDKDLCFMEQYDSDLFIGKSKLQQVEYLHKGLLNSILRIVDMKRKPKDFDVEKFYNVIDTLMIKYENEYCH